MCICGRHFKIFSSDIYKTIYKYTIYTYVYTDIFWYVNVSVCFSSILLFFLPAQQNIAEITFILNTGCAFHSWKKMH